VNQQEHEEEQAYTSGLFFFFFFFCQANTVHGPFFKPLQLPLLASYLMFLPEPHFSAISAISPSHCYSTRPGSPPQKSTTLMRTQTREREGERKKERKR
jgi:hypothetical protein